MSHLYACLFSTGVIKVGRAAVPSQRIRQHADRVACMGVQLVESRIFDCVGEVHLAESAVLDRCRLYASKQFKREWFEGLQFSLVCEWLEEEASRGYQRAQINAHAPSELSIDPQEDRRFKCSWEDGKHTWIDEAPHEVLWPDALMRWDLRQTDWHQIWPELIDHPCAILFAPNHPARNGPPRFQDWVKSWPSAEAGAHLFASMPEQGQEVAHLIWPELAKPRKPKTTTAAA